MRDMKSSPKLKSDYNKIYSESKCSHTLYFASIWCLVFIRTKPVTSSISLCFPSFGVVPEHHRRGPSARGGCVTAVRNMSPGVLLGL